MDTGHTDSEKIGLELGKLLSKVRAKGSLTDILRKLEIPDAVANYWMSRYEGYMPEEVIEKYTQYLYHNMGRGAKKTNKGFVYFIQDQSSQLIKIGWAVNVQQRIATLQTGNPTPLQLLGTIVGGQFKEAELHETFSYLRVNREWFRPAKELMHFINCIATI